MAGRGGARHFKKPFVETGLLTQCLKKHSELLKDFKGYETLSRNSGPDPKALYHALGFVDDLLALEPCGEIHGQPLRNGLLSLLTSNPHWNCTKQTGSVWVHMRSERINVLLFHVRKLARSGLSAAFASALTSLEYQRLQETLAKVELPDAAVVPLEKGKQQEVPLEKEKDMEKKTKKRKEDEEEAPLENGRSSGSKDPAPLKKGKGLKKTLSDVSLDSDGFPKALKSPPKPKPGRLFKKRVGQKRPLDALSAGGEEDNREAMGFSVRKKPAASSAKPLKKGTKEPLKKGTKEPLKKGTKAAANMSGPGPWLKLHKVMAAKPQRAYILGTKSSEVKPKLVVEVSQTMSKKYSFVIDKIKDALQAQNLSKEEAKDLRKKLCEKYP